MELNEISDLILAMWFWITEEYPIIAFIAGFIVIMIMYRHLTGSSRKRREGFWELADSEPWDDARNKERRERVHLRILMDIEEYLIAISTILILMFFGFLFGWF